MFRRVSFVGTHDLCVRCVKGYGVRGFNGDGRTDRASLQPLLVGWFDDSYSSRASLPRVTRFPR